MTDTNEAVDPQQGACSHKWRPLSWGYSYCEQCGASDPTLEAVKAKAFVDGIEEARRLDSEAGAHQEGAAAVQEALFQADILANPRSAMDAPLGATAKRLVTLAAEVRRLQAQHPATRNESGAASVSGSGAPSSLSVRPEVAHPKDAISAVIGKVSEVGGDWEIALMPDNTTWLTVHPKDCAAAGFKRPEVGDVVDIVPPRIVGIRRTEPPAEAQTLSSGGTTLEVSDAATKSVGVQQPAKPNNKDLGEP